MLSPTGHAPLPRTVRIFHTPQILQRLKRFRAPNIHEHHLGGTQIEYLLLANLHQVIHRMHTLLDIEIVNIGLLFFRVPQYIPTRGGLPSKPKICMNTMGAHS